MREWKTLYRMLVMASVAHARWEVEISSNILKDKRRMWLLGLLGGSAVLISVAFAADLPAMLGGKEAYTPSFYTPTTFLVSTIIGLCAGLITGAIGAGGGFIITPALMSAGV